MLGGNYIKFDENGRAIPLTWEECQDAAAGLYQFAHRIRERNCRAPMPLCPETIRSEADARVVLMFGGNPLAVFADETEAETLAFQLNRTSDHDGFWVKDFIPSDDRENPAID